MNNFVWLRKLRLPDEQLRRFLKRLKRSRSAELLLHYVPLLHHTCSPTCLYQNKKRLYLPSMHPISIRSGRNTNRDTDRLDTHTHRLYFLNTSEIGAFSTLINETISPKPLRRSILVHISNCQLYPCKTVTLGLMTSHITLYTTYVYIHTYIPIHIHLLFYIS